MAGSKQKTAEKIMRNVSPSRITITLMTILRDYYRGRVLYLCTDKDLRSLQKRWQDEVNRLEAAEKTQEAAPYKTLVDRCSAILTLTGLWQAINAPFVSETGNGLMLLDAAQRQRLKKLVALQYDDPDYADLLYAWRQGGSRKKVQIESLTTGERKYYRFLKTSPKQKTKEYNSQKNGVQIVERKTRLKAVQIVRYKDPATGEVKWKDKGRVLDMAYGCEIGVDRKKVANAVQDILDLQTRSEAAEEDISADLGFRLKKLLPEDVFPELPDAELEVLFPTDDTPLYKILPTAASRSLSMSFISYMPYLSGPQREQLLAQFHLNKDEKALYGMLNKDDEDEIDEENDLYNDRDSTRPIYDFDDTTDPLQEDFLKTLEDAQAAVLHTMLSYQHPTQKIYDPSTDTVTDIPFTGNHLSLTEEPSFWYEFDYYQWVWDTAGGKNARLMHKNRHADGAKIQMLPIKVTSSDGKLHLTGLRLDMFRKYTKPGKNWVLSNLRIDLIQNITIMSVQRGGKLLNPENDPAELLQYYNELQPAEARSIEYRNNHPLMYSDDVKGYKLLCSPRVTNVLVDTFGADSLWYSGQAPGPDGQAWNLVQVFAGWLGLRLFLLQNQESVILADLPTQQKERADLRSVLQKSLDLYC